MPGFRLLSLLQTRTYPGYQFYATMKYDGLSAERCMKYIILTVLDWLRTKIGGVSIPEELMAPPAKDFAKVTDEQIHSYHFSGGFSLDITALLERGIWAARIKEPDVERDDKKAVIGRSFVTEIGLHCRGDEVECGIRIDVLDPLDVTEEVTQAYRPGFLRNLFETSKLRIRQVELLKYNKAHVVNGAAAMKQLFSLIASADNFMPTIVLTYASEQRNVQEIVEKLDKNLGLTGQPGSFMARLSQIDLVPETLEFGDAVLPYDAEYMAYHTFGYGRVYVIADKKFADFKEKIGKPSLQPGDMVWIEPARFGGNCRVISYDSQAAVGVREAQRNRIIEDAHRYSKHKIVPFGGVVFEASARRMEIEERIKTKLQVLRSDDEQKNEKRVEEIYRETEELTKLYEDENKDLQARCEQLTRDLQEQETKLAVLSAKNYQPVKKPEGGICIQVPEVQEYFTDEQRDLIISILQEAKRSYCTEGSRADELLDGILAMNEITGEGRKIFERLKAILYRNKNITESDISDLREIGFEVTRRANNHYKLVFKNDDRYAFTMASTASDVRSMKNSFSEITNRISIYKK
jgi:hypothetical protein